MHTTTEYMTAQRNTISHYVNILRSAVTHQVKSGFDKDERVSEGHPHVT